MAKSEDPDQMAQNVASDQSLQCFALKHVYLYKNNKEINLIRQASEKLYVIACAPHAQSEQSLWIVKDPRFPQD